MDGHESSDNHIAISYFSELDDVSISSDEGCATLNETCHESEVAQKASPKYGSSSAVIVNSSDVTSSADIIRMRFERNEVVYKWYAVYDHSRGFGSKKLDMKKVNRVPRYRMFTCICQGLRDEKRITNEYRVCTHLAN